MSSKKKLAKVENALITKLKRIYQHYQERLKHLKHAKVTSEEAGSIIGAGVASGTLLGTVIPGLGNIVGAVCGFASSAIAIGSIALHRYRMSRKLHNAEKITELLASQPTEEMFKEVAKELVKERKEILTNLIEPNSKKIINYLAKQAIANLKHKAKIINELPEEHQNQAIKTALIEGVKEVRSHRALSFFVPIKSNGITHAPYTLKDLAENKEIKYYFKP